MKTTKMTLVATLAGAAAVATAPLAQAADSPFGLQKLDSGYQLAQADKKMDGKCGEGKCGADKKAAEKKKDGSCGADKKKDGSCGGDKKKDGSCGGDKKKDGSCGGMKK